MSTTVCMVLYHLCIKVECCMCIYIGYLWRETQEMNDCGLPVGNGTQELDCGGVKSYLFFFKTYFLMCILTPFEFFTICMGYF